MTEKFISIIIPAYNEQEYIESTIKNIKSVFQALKVKHEIIVVDNNSTDKTKQIAQSLNAIVLEEKIKNIGVVRNTGAKTAKGNLIIFIDADAKINQKLVAKAIDSFKNKKVKLVSTISAFDKYENLISLGVWFYNIFALLKKLPVGTFFCIRKKDFKSVSGFDNDTYAFEEIYFKNKIVNKWGKESVKILTTPVINSNRNINKKENQIDFVMQLFGAALNKKVGKNKDTLDFWYENNNIHKSKTTKNNKHKIKKYVFYTALLLLLLDPSLNFVSFTSLVPENIATLMIFILLTYVLIDKLWPFLIIFTITMITEIISVKTGVPFGFYNYSNQHLYLAILGVPIFIGLAWYIITATLSAIFDKWYVVGIFVVLVDILLEVFAYTKGLWYFSETSFKIFNAPIQNYITWFLLGSISFFVYKKFNNKPKLFYTAFVLTAILFNSTLFLLINKNYVFALYGFILIIVILYFAFRKALQKYISN